MYEYRAKVVKVYDGDTITCDIDLGFSVTLRREKIRLLDINAPEIRGADRPTGLESRDALRRLILDKQVIIKTKKDRKGKYGRWLAHVYLPAATISVNDMLVNAGFAQPHIY